MTEPYYADDTVTLYLGDMREVLPRLGQFDCAVTDPPYGETSLAWDRWPDGWPGRVACHTASMWCFGSMRMFMEHVEEFTEFWQLSQDVVWEKHNGSGFAADRFKRVHEIATHWYAPGEWRAVHHETPREDGNAHRRGGGRTSANRTPHAGEVGDRAIVDDGQRMVRSVIRVRSMNGLGAVHPTQKPLGILEPLITYACPPGGTVLDPFAGSGSTLVAARDSGRKAVGVEADERYCEAIATRLQHQALPVGDPR